MVFNVSTTQFKDILRASANESAIIDDAHGDVRENERMRQHPPFLFRGPVFHLPMNTSFCSHITDQVGDQNI